MKSKERLDETEVENEFDQLIEAEKAETGRVSFLIRNNNIKELLKGHATS